MCSLSSSVYGNKTNVFRIELVRKDVGSRFTGWIGDRTSDIINIYFIILYIIKN